MLQLREDWAALRMCIVAWQDRNGFGAVARVLDSLSINATSKAIALKF
jgi:hypothetical protein